MALEKDNKMKAVSLSCYPHHHQAHPSYSLPLSRLSCRDLIEIKHERTIFHRTAEHAHYLVESYGRDY